MIDKSTTLDVIPSPARALFDPNFTPNELLHRTTELDLFESILSPAISEGYSVNILNLGVRGIGKTVLSNYIPLYLLTTHPEFRKVKFSLIRINCAYKNDSAIGWSLARSLEVFGEEWRNIPQIPPEQLWYELSLAIKKRQKSGLSFVIILDEIDSSYLENYNRLIRWAKELNLSTITNSQSSFTFVFGENKENWSWIDAKIHLKPYTARQLYDIVEQRINLAFTKTKVPVDVISLIVDLVAEYDCTRPSTCMEILRLVYPKVVKNKSLTPELIREACFETGVFMDDGFDLISNGTEISKPALYLAKGLVSYFEKYHLAAHISMTDLWQRYLLKCEEFGTPSTLNEFQAAVAELERFGWISLSHHKRNHYYTLINPKMMREAVDLLLGCNK